MTENSITIARIDMFDYAKNNDRLGNAARWRRANSAFSHYENNIVVSTQVLKNTAIDNGIHINSLIEMFVGQHMPLLLHYILFHINTLL
jgi:hypothetical protein